MRPRTLLSRFSAFLVLSRPTSAYRLDASPFSSTFLDETPERSETAPSDTSPLLGLIKRQSCPEKYNSCSGLSNANSGSNCCAENSVCALDNAGNIACCPLGSFCTGTVTAAPTATSTPSNGATSSGMTITDSANPSQTVVPNDFYPFPILFGQNEHFSDAEQCSESYDNCSSHYSQCTQQLQGGGFGVTVAAPAGGVTVAPGSYRDVGVQSATSICSSLSSQACPGSGATCTGAGGAESTPTGSGFFIVTPGNDGSAGNRRAPGGAEMALLMVIGWFVVGCLE